MVSQPRSQCSTCTRFRSPIGTGRTEPFCAAFPDAIPADVFANLRDHRQPIDGDHGLQWETDGRPYPEYALVKGTA